MASVMTEDAGVLLVIEVVASDSVVVIEEVGAAVVIMQEEKDTGKEEGRVDSILLGWLLVHRTFEYGFR